MAEQKKQSTCAVWTIITILTIVVLLLSMWYYSQQVADYTGQEVTGCIGSVYDEMCSWS